MSAPDWIILGQPLPDHSFVVYASDQLTQAELESVRVDEYDDFWCPVKSPVVDHYLKLTMKQYYVVHGHSYQDCLTKLFQTWTPPEPAPREIDHRKEIEKWT